MEEGTPTINRTFARAFINFLAQTMHVEMNPLFRIDPRTGAIFSSLSDAQGSVLRDLAELVDNKDEVYAEYDRLLNKLKAAQPDNDMALVLEAGRKQLVKMLTEDGISH